MQHKFLLSISVALLSIVSFSAMKPKHLNGQQKLVDIFAADSVYIFKDKAIALQMKAMFKDAVPSPDNDSVDIIGSRYNTTDTIGKFYRHQNGNYIVCTKNIILIDQMEVHFVMEVKPDGSVLYNDFFYDGMYLCCGKNMRDGFLKHGKYYILKECGTGSGYCSTNLYIFKSLYDPSVTTPIRTKYFIAQCENGLACHLTSILNIHNDTVTVNYKSEKLKRGRKRDKVKTRERFRIDYVLTESGWRASDSTRLKNFYD